MALIGFDPDEANSIIAAFSDVDAIARVVQPGPDLPGLNPYGFYDVCIVNCVAAGEEAPPIARIARTRHSMLLVGELERILPILEQVAFLKNDFVVRPFRIEEMLLKADRLVRDADSPVKGEEGAHARRVLIVDDEELDSALIQAILTHVGFECEIARDGKQGIEMARRERPDVMLLDVFMPVMGGFDTLAALRADPTLHDLPVIMCTSDPAERGAVRGLQSGADDYIVKPFNAEEMVARVDRVVRNAESRRTSD